MQQRYCRHCAFCINPDPYYCTLHEKEMTESYVKHTNNCKDFALSDLGDVDTGKKYTPHTVSHSKKIDGQMSFSDYDGMPYQFDNMTGGMNL